MNFYTSGWLTYGEETNPTVSEIQTQNTAEPRFTDTPDQGMAKENL